MDDDPYAFLTGNTHSRKAYESVSWLQEKGVNFWDEIIDTEEAIVDGICGCSLFIVLVSPEGAEDSLTRDEVICAMSNRRPFLVIHLEMTTLPEGLQLAFAGQATVRMYEDGWKKEIEEILEILWKPMLG